MFWACHFIPQVYEPVDSIHSADFFKQNLSVFLKDLLWTPLIWVLCVVVEVDNRRFYRLMSADFCLGLSAVFITFPTYGINFGAPRSCERFKDQQSLPIDVNQGYAVKRFSTYGRRWFWLALFLRKLTSDRLNLSRYRMWSL